MDRPTAVVVILAPVAAVAVVAVLWIHMAFGIIVPWDRPHFFHVCGREYRRGGEPMDGYSFTVHPTVFELPIPMPDVAPIAGSAEWGGCPLQVRLERDGEVSVYGFIQGGP